MIAFDHVGLRYPRPAERDLTPHAALADISFTVASGGFRWLLGPSGAGKTSLLRLLHLTERPSEGTISVLGQRIGPERGRRSDLPRLRRRIGMVFQDFRLLDHCTVWENVALPLRLDRRPEAQVRSDVDEMLRWVGLARHAGRRPRELSGGEQQRVAVARAVVGRPSLLLADEPTGNLDPPLAARVMRLLGEMNRQGVTVVVATHSAALVEAHPGPMLRLDSGRLVGSPDD